MYFFRQILFERYASLLNIIHGNAMQCVNHYVSRIFLCLVPVRKQIGEAGEAVESRRRGQCLYRVQRIF